MPSTLRSADMLSAEVEVCICTSRTPIVGAACLWSKRGVYGQAEDLKHCSVVHDTGLKTRTGTRVWVWRVWVRVRFEAPAPNPYPCHGFGGFLYINNIKYNIIKLNKNTSLASPKMVFDITRRVVHLLATPKMVFGVTKRCTNT